MSFDLKNVGATYQRLMDKIFAEQIGHCMDVFDDDMVVPSKSGNEHIRDLVEVFTQVRHYSVRLNSMKCTFGVAVEKFLLTTRGIEANPDKCATVLEMRSLAKVKEIQRFIGRLTSLSQFISKLAKHFRPVIR